jgi:hypothetical protein
VYLLAAFGHSIKEKIMSKEFDKNAFEVRFARSIVALARSEKVTRGELQLQSRAVIEALHSEGPCHGDIGYTNRLIDVLTPVNKKVAIEFFKTFLGFSFDDKLNMFTSKSKKRYAQAKGDAVKFLEDPMNNIWSWAARNIEITQKDFTLEAVTKSIEGYLKKANNNGFSQADVMRAIIKGGISADSIIACMDELGFDVAVESEKE